MKVPHTTINACYFKQICLTSRAASRMNCLAGSSQMAGTVITHLMFSVLNSVSTFFLSTIFIKSSFMNLMQWVKTSLAEISFPFESLIVVLLHSPYINKNQKPLQRYAFIFLTRCFFTQMIYRRFFFTQYISLQCTHLVSVQYHFKMLKKPQVFGIFTFTKFSFCCVTKGLKVSISL